MEKKALITPVIEVVSLNLTMEVLTTISGGDTNIVGSDNEEDDEGYVQRSRIWSDESDEENEW